MGKTFARVINGMPVAFYHEDFHGAQIPEDVVEISEEEYASHVRNLPMIEEPIVPTLAALARERLALRPLGPVTPAAFEDLLVAIGIK